MSSGGVKSSVTLDGMPKVQTTFYYKTDINCTKAQVAIGIRYPCSLQAVNDVYSLLDLVYLVGQQTRKYTAWRVLRTVLKLKGIDGNLTKWWSMWFKLIIHVKSYPS